MSDQVVAITHYTTPSGLDGKKSAGPGLYNSFYV